MNAYGKIVFIALFFTVGVISVAVRLHVNGRERQRQSETDLQRVQVRLIEAINLTASLSNELVKVRSSRNIGKESPETSVPSIDTVTVSSRGANIQSGAEDHDRKVRAESGEADAQYQVGLGLAKGMTVTPDLINAYKWLHLAAEQGYPPAIYSRYEVTLQMSQHQIIEAKRLASEFAQRLIK